MQQTDWLASNRLSRGPYVDHSGNPGLYVLLRSHATMVKRRSNQFIKESIRELYNRNYLFRFEAYEDSDDKEEKNFASYENTAIFCVSMFQYITEAVIFSKGAPYRRSIFSNGKFKLSTLNKIF